jgi:hypothetical protein
MKLLGSRLGGGCLPSSTIYALAKFSFSGCTADPAHGRWSPAGLGWLLSSNSPTVQRNSAHQSTPYCVRFLLCWFRISQFKSICKELLLCFGIKQGVVHVMSISLTSTALVRNMLASWAGQFQWGFADTVDQYLQTTYQGILSNTE